MDEAWHQTTAAFTAAARWFGTVVESGDGHWDAAGLGVWDVRALAGHTSRALLTLETYLGTPAASVDVPSTADYYLATVAGASDEDVAQRGRDAGAALGSDPVAAVAAIVGRVPPLLEDIDGDLVVTTIVGGIRLRDYVPTRTFELVVHTLDLASALDLAVEPPPAAATEALRVVADLAPRRGSSGHLLLAATGRAGLPPGFTIL